MPYANPFLAGLLAARCRCAAVSALLVIFHLFPPLSLCAAGEAPFILPPQQELNKIKTAVVYTNKGDLRFEPPTALASGADGLDAIRVLAQGARAHLVPGGWLLVEHGWNQGAAVRALFAGAGLRDVATERDLEARDRVTLGRAPGAAGAG